MIGSYEAKCNYIAATAVVSTAAGDGTQRGGDIDKLLGRENIVSPHFT